MVHGSILNGSIKMVNREIGFSLWLDFIERDFLKNEFATMIEKGIINGATSNPSIFASAITTSPAYQQQLASLAGKSAKDKYEALAIKDIKHAAQILRPLYDEGNDGYISIEVDPYLSNSYKQTLEEGKRLFHEVGEPNVMIKIPATEAGYKAMQGLLTNGIPVNATLIFSPDQARKCLDAMKIGLDKFEKLGGRRCEAVISIFVSRFDRFLDDQLKHKGIEVTKTGIYNAAKIYNLIEANRTPAIRTLFASTGVKGDTPEAAYYMKALYGAHCVNTAPLATIEAFQHSGVPEVMLPIDEETLEDYFNQLEAHGVLMDDVYDTLLREGLEAFEKAFKEMLDSLK
ncbi:MAG: hypothetical protein RL113_1185 [Pseudomonadota bacterium]